MLIFMLEHFDGVKVFKQDFTNKRVTCLWLRPTFVDSF